MMESSHLEAEYDHCCPTPPRGCYESHYCAIHLLILHVAVRLLHVARLNTLPPRLLSQSQRQFFGLHVSERQRSGY